MSTPKVMNDDALHAIYEKLRQRHESKAEETKQEYDQIYEQMVDKLSTAHFEPLNEVLRQHDAEEFNFDSAMDKIKKDLLQSITSDWGNHWDSDVVPNVIKLEILKDYFKADEGKNWNMSEKTPEERWLPTHMRYKQMSKRMLLRLLEHQNKELKELVSRTNEHRALIRNVSKEVLQLNAQLNIHKDLYAEWKPKLVQLFNLVLDETYSKPEEKD